MKLLYKFFILIIILIIPNISFAWELSDDSNSSVHYCNGGGCGLTNGVNQVGAEVTDIVTDRGFSEYIQDIVIYILTFVSIIAVIYFIYAGFIILTSAGDEEKIKKTKKIMIYVIIGILTIWFAWSILIWFLGVLNSNGSGNCDYCYSLPSGSSRDNCLVIHGCR